ncbi:MAG TPA: hypothetical protein PKD15_00520 [Candidatus Saccharibacteria bacterium]|jgi:thymidylate kinase|nr:hypothetical protein [Candidatus Saccharibacteria bacterium]
MLQLFHQLFSDIERRGLEYSTFKSLEHLQADLSGDRGDVDIWISDRDKETFLSIARENRLFVVRWSPTKGVAFILIGWDILSGKKVLVHVHTAPIAVKKRSYIPLYFIYQDMPKPKRKKYTLSLPSEKWVDTFEKNRKKLKKTPDLTLIKHVLLNKRYIVGLHFNFNARETLRIYNTYFNRFIRFRGHYRIRRKGLLVAFVGIDGSGKSSAVSTLSASDFLKTSFGVKEAYFGNKNFWIPGIEKGRAKDKKLTSFKKLLMGIGMIDIKLRIIPALWAKYRGSLVLCDRYFYDSMITDPTKKYISSPLLRSILNPIITWMPSTPNITFYMRVSPKIAYARKQDYPLDKVEEACSAYDKLMLNRPEVIVIDANKSFEDVAMQIRHELIGYIQENLK